MCAAWYELVGARNEENKSRQTVARNGENGFPSSSGAHSCFYPPSPLQVLRLIDRWVRKYRAYVSLGCVCCMPDKESISPGVVRLQVGPLCHLA